MVNSRNDIKFPSAFGGLKTIVGYFKIAAMAALFLAAPMPGQATYFGDSANVFKTAIIVNELATIAPSAEARGALWKLARMSRSTVYLTRHIFIVGPHWEPNPGNVAELLEDEEADTIGSQSGFLVNSTTLLASEHGVTGVRGSDREENLWNTKGRFEYGHGILHFALDPDKGERLHEFWLRERLVQLGLHTELGVEGNDIARFKEISGSMILEDYHEAEGRDVVSIKIPEVALRYTKIPGVATPSIPIGVLFDFLPITNNQADRPRTRNTTREDIVSSLHIAHENLPGNDQSLTIMVSPFGPVGTNDRAHECGQHITGEGYKGCLGADVALVNGSSGGASVFFKDGGTNPVVIGVNHAASPGGFGLSSPDDTDVWRTRRFPLDPNDDKSTTLTLITDRIATSVRGHRPQPSDIGPTRRSPTTSGDLCAGHCDLDPDQYRLRECSEAWENDPEAQPGAKPAIGLIGVPWRSRFETNSSIKGIGSIGVVCHWWTKKLYTSYWSDIKVVGHVKRDDQAEEFPNGWRSLISVQRNARIETPADIGGTTRLSAIPMQLCPPGYLMNGFDVGVINGNVISIENLHCRAQKRRHEVVASLSVIPELIQMIGNTNAEDIEAVGGADFEIRQLKCPGGQVVTGIKVDAKHEGPVSSIEPACVAFPFP